MNRLTKRLGLRALLALICLVTGAALGSAQEGSWLDADDPSAQIMILERNREGMRFRDAPLTVVGNEQGDNNFRSNTPALMANVSTEVVLVDTDELYARKMAIYSGAERFTQPLESRVAATPRSTNRIMAPRTRGGEAPVEPAPFEPEESLVSRWLWLVSLGFLTLVAGIFLHRNGYLITGQE